jgi:hypothetical protein
MEYHIPSGLSLHQPDIYMWISRLPLKYSTADEVFFLCRDESVYRRIIANDPLVGYGGAEDMAVIKNKELRFVSRDGVVYEMRDTILSMTDPTKYSRQSLRHEIYTPQWVNSVHHRYNNIYPLTLKKKPHNYSHTLLVYEWLERVARRLKCVRDEFGDSEMVPESWDRSLQWIRPIIPISYPVQRIVLEAASQRLLTLASH